MKAFVIDPTAQTITEAEYHGNYREIYTLGGFDCFDLVRLDGENGIFVDDEGLFKSDQDFFGIKGYPQPLAGRGVVLGNNMEGETIAPTVTKEWLEQNIVFLGGL